MASYPLQRKFRILSLVIMALLLAPYVLLGDIAGSWPALVICLFLALLAFRNRVVVREDCLIKQFLFFSWTIRFSQIKQLAAVPNGLVVGYRHPRKDDLFGIIVVKNIYDRFDAFIEELGSVSGKKIEKG